MVQQRELLWECSNDYDTEISYQRGTTVASANQGVCAGLAIEWCKNILKGVRPELSKPFLMQGMLYQRFYDWGSDDATRNSNMFSKAGVSGSGHVRKSNARRSAKHMWTQRGVYWGGYNCHAIAVVKVDTIGPHLFFDPNFGCYAVHSELRLAELFRQGRRAVGARNWMEFYSISISAG